MARKLFHFPELSRPDFGLFRGPGPGLGNLLFPIARALQAYSKTGGIMVLPTMRQVKVGPYIRREKDKRTYGEIFRRRTLAENRDWTMAKLLRSRLENEVDASARVIRYAGMGRQFHDLSANPDHIRRFLQDASRLPVFSREYDIAIHVRLGDFAAPSATATSQNTQIPFEWYREALSEARAMLGKQSVCGILFSDEAPEIAIEKLGLDGFVPEPQGNALTSILLMSQAKILIGLRSTFSLWGQYLGQCRALWSQRDDPAKYKRPNPEQGIFV